MKSSFKLIYFAFAITSVAGECLINYPKDSATRPIYTYVRGSRALSIRFDVYPDSFNLFENQTILGYCATGFVDFVYLKKDTSRYYYDDRFVEVTERSQKSIQIHCEGNTIWYNKYGTNYKLSGDSFSCKRLTWHLYESSAAFDWCAENTESYLVGSKDTGTDIIRGGICYDNEKLTLANVLYWEGNEIGDQRNLRFTKPSSLDALSLAAEVKFHKSETSWRYHKLDVYKNSLPQLEHLLDYQLHTLVDKLSIYDIHIMEVAWWTHLRLGNWKLFENALASHISKSNASYTIYAGASGNLQILEASGNCSMEPNTAFKVSSEGYNDTVHTYIWKYLQSTNNDEEFVFVGFNSPFSEFFNASDISFCEDICDSIEWLRNVRGTFRYSMLGVVFCCRPDEVRSHLPGFPLQHSKTTDTVNLDAITSSESTIAPTIPTTAISNNDASDEDD